jgi:TrmH family RNA methyltransferase
MNDKTNPNFRQLDITSTLSAIERLQNERAYRDARRLFFIEGVRNFIAAIDHRYPFEALPYSEKLLTNPISRKLVRKLKRAGVPFARVTPEQFRSVSRTERASGVGAILRQRVYGLDQIGLDQSHSWVSLSRVRSPGNFGSLVRTSAACGGTGFILTSDRFDPFDPGPVRATMGAFFKQKIVRTSTERMAGWVRKHKIQVIGASPDGSVAYDQCVYRHPLVLLLGDERKGLTEDQRRMCDHVVRIPMVRGMDSLNLSVAGSLLMYEAFRSTR